MNNHLETQFIKAMTAVLSFNLILFLIKILLITCSFFPIVLFEWVISTSEYVTKQHCRIGVVNVCSHTAVACHQNARSLLDCLQCSTLHEHGISNLSEIEIFL